MESIELSRYCYGWPNPYVPPDRRYRTAKLCQSRGILPSFCRDGKPTWDIWRYLRKRAAAYDPKQQVRLLRENHDLAIAFCLHHGRMRHLRPLIEAYLLAAADDDSIAGRVAAPPDAIRWFRLAFYDVAHYLQSPLYVHSHLIREIDKDGQAQLDTHRLWKLLGYMLGPNALDQLLHNTEAEKQTFKVGGLAAWFTQRTQAVLQSKQFVAASNLNPNEQKHVGLLLKLLMDGLHSQGQPDDQPLNHFEQCVNAMLQELPWCKGPELTPESVRKWDETAVELPDDELLLVAAGEKLSPESEELKNLEIPLMRDPPHKEKPNSSEGK